MESKVALITGSTSGIGLGIAKKLAHEGYNICLNGFGDATEIENLRQTLESETGRKVIYHGADMTDRAQIEDLFSTIDQTFNRLDVLVNNAGIQFVSPVQDFPADRWKKIIELNLTSNFHTIQLALPRMEKNKWGRIINIASAHGLVASPFKSAYVAAKHGVLGLTKTVALEVAEKNITVNSICPGYVRTPLVEAQLEDTAKARGISVAQVLEEVIKGAQPTNRFVEVSEVADFTHFLTTHAAQNMTGSSYSMDGGWTAK